MNIGVEILKLIIFYTIAWFTLLLCVKIIGVEISTKKLLKVFLSVYLTLGILAGLISSFVPGASTEVLIVAEILSVIFITGYMPLNMKRMLYFLSIYIFFLLLSNFIIGIVIGN